MQLVMLARDVMLRHRRLVGIGAVIVSFHAGSAAAQDDPRTGARFHTGPVYITPTIAASDVGIDTNVYNASGVNTRDFTFTITPAFTALVGPRRANLSVRSVTDLVYFSEQKSERSANEDFSSSARVAFGRITPFADMRYLNTRERVTDEIDARARRVERRGGAGVELAVTPKVAAVVRGDLFRMNFDADARFDGHWLAEELNRKARTVFVGVRYVVTPLTTVTVGTSASRTRFAVAPIRDTDSRETDIRVELHPRALIFGTARFGYQRFQPTNGADVDLTGLVGNGTLGYRIRSLTTIGLTYERGVSFSYLPGTPYYLRQGFGLSVQRQVMPGWDLTLNGERMFHRYRSGVGPDVPLLNRSERLFGGAATLGHSIGPRTRVSFAFSYYDRRSEFTERRGYNGLRAGTSVVYGF